MEHDKNQEPVSGLADVTSDTRRSFLKTSVLAAASALAAPALLIPSKARAADKIVVGSYGGTYGEALDTAFFKPFTQETGIAVVQTGAVDLALLKAQTMNNMVAWDMIETTQTEILTAVNEGLVQPIDYSIVQMDPNDLIYQDARAKHWVTAYTYTGGIAYNTSTAAGRHHPNTFSEFWDVKAFPGRRGLRARPNENIEIALLADGVAPKSVYPIDLDRSFKSLDRIKPSITKWTQTAPQSVELLQTNELDYSYTYHNRVFAAVKSGLPLAIAKGQQLVFMNIFAVPKGAQNSKAAMQLLNFMMRPDRQAQLCELVGLLPITKKGTALVSPKIREDWAPDMSNSSNLLVNGQWWGEPGRLAQITSRFQKWMVA